MPWRTRAARSGGTDHVSWGSGSASASPASSTRCGSRATSAAAKALASARWCATMCASCSPRAGGWNAGHGERTAGPGRAGSVSATEWRHRLDDTRVLAVVLCVVWGLMFVVQRVALEVAPPVWVAAGRASVGALVLLAFVPSLRGLSRRGIGVAIVLGLTNQFAFLGLQVAGLRTVEAGPAAAIIYLQPVLVVLSSGPFLGERLTRRRIAGALLGFAGVAVVGLHQSATASAGGVLLLLAAAVSWSAGAVVTSATTEPIVALVVGQHLVGAPLLVALAAAALHLAGAPFPVPPPGGAEPFPALSTKLVLCVGFAGVFGPAFAWMLWSQLMQRGEAGVVSTWLFAVPMLAAVFGVVLLGEPMSLALVVGIALVAAAVRLATSSPRSGREADATRSRPTRSHA